MKKELGFVILLILAIGFFVYGEMTGHVSSQEIMGISDYRGPTLEDSECLKKCFIEEGKEKNICMLECNVEDEPEAKNEEESCMQKCILVGCEEYDLECRNKNIPSCEIECGMIHEKEAQSEEEQCIRDCVNLHDPDAECSNSAEGETGNSVCQMCAQQCVHLYEGPCLNDEQIREKESECKTCEHCYGEPVMGPSGQGWDCIVDIECFDASSEWGDEPGEGPGIGQEGYVAPNPLAKGVDGMIKFFKGIFGGDSDMNPEDQSFEFAEENNQEKSSESSEEVLESEESIFREE